jgi:hypothetical protein
MDTMKKTIDERANEKQMRACAAEWESTYNGPSWSIGDHITVSIRNHGKNKKRAKIVDGLTGISATVVASKGATAYAMLGSAINQMADFEAELSRQA